MGKPLRLHAFEPASRANGPGWQAVVWTQGCPIGCPLCFNPLTHAADGGRLGDTEEILSWIMSGPQPIEGVSVSGGEPFQHPEALRDLLERVRGSGKSTLVFSGYTLEAIRQMPSAAFCLENIDVLIAGPYAAAQHAARGLLGSANQKIHFLTSRYSLKDLERVPEIEVILHAKGGQTRSGIRGQG